MTGMLRLLGAAFVVAGLAGLGSLRAAGLDGRVLELAEWCRAMEQLRAWIAHLRMPAGQALRAVAAGSREPVAAVLRHAAAQVEQGAALWAGQALWMACQSLRGRSWLLEEDRVVLQAFCQQFGRLDGTNQLRAFDVACEGLRQALERAREDQRRLSRLARFSGLAAGLGVVALLL